MMASLELFRSSTALSVVTCLELEEIKITEFVEKYVSFLFVTTTSANDYKTKPKSKEIIQIMLSFLS